jgi:hypothetical protein
MIKSLKSPHIHLTFIKHTSFLLLFHDNQEFNKKSNSLYTILRSSRLAGSQRAPFLRQFLMRLNFNSFFEVCSANYGTLNIDSTNVTF